MSDISRVNQYRHVISEDMKMDILPLEQDITDGAQNDEVVQVDTSTAPSSPKLLIFSRRSSGAC